MSVPFSFLSLCPENPGSGRWDQAWVTRLLRGEEWTVPAGFRFREEEYDFASTHGRVVIFPAGHYSNCDSCTESVGRKRLMTELNRLDWAVVIATSDECSQFRWDHFGLPAHVRLWVMTPRPEHSYPKGTFFIPDGSPHRFRDIPLGERDVDVFFSGQLGHERRDQCVAAIAALAKERPDLAIALNPTAGFTQGLSTGAYLGMMSHSKFAPCPSGPCTQDSFRFFEALEAGCYPLRDAVRADGGGLDYWGMVGLSDVGSHIIGWEKHLSLLLDVGYDDWPALAAHTSSRWQQYKRRVAHRLDADVWSAAWDWSMGEIGGGPGGPDDEITVIIPTSPIPSHPDTSVIEQTIASIRERLPRAEILITCDDVREEQMERYDDYYEYVRRLALLCNHQQNVCPFTSTSHQHQSGMMKAILPEVHTPYVLYVEHDCPLVGDIDFAEIIAVMGRDELASMRFLHETEIQPGSEHLIFEPQDGYARTVQWSQRPHLAHTNWYRDIMATYFGKRARTMIEDVMHGVVQSNLPTWKPDLKSADAKQWNRALDKTWRRWRMAVYAPEGSWKRSTHLDGRATDPKYPMTVLYDGERPPGAPPEGVLG